MKSKPNQINRLNLWGQHNPGVDVDFWWSGSIGWKKGAVHEIDWSGPPNSCLYGFYGYHDDNGDIKGLGFKYRTLEKQEDPGVSIE